jgi:Uma2 family endonuclease
MVDQLIRTDEYGIPDASQLVTEDDTPVDNFASAKQQCLLVTSLYSALSGQIFLAESNVGIYHTAKEPAIVPDVFVSFDVQAPENWWEKQQRCYFVWNFGKPPEIVIELVSNQVGDELTEKLDIYQHMRASYYVVYDPNRQLGDRPIRIYELRGRRYLELDSGGLESYWLEQVGLGLTLWEGEFEDRQDRWLRWCDRQGQILLTGDEQAKQAQRQVKQAQDRAEQIQRAAIAQLLTLGMSQEQIAQTLGLTLADVQERLNTTPQK